QPKGLRGGFARGIGPQGALAAPPQAVEPVGRDHRTRVDDHERAHEVRVPGRERHRVVTAHRVADERDARRAERADEAEQVGGEVFGRVGRRVGPLALPVAALIERERVEAIGERGRDEVEPVRVRGAAVEETEDRAADDSPLEKVQPQPADHDGTFARSLASKACDGWHAPNCIRKIFALYALAHQLLSKVPMSDEITSKNRRRNVLDGAYTAGLLIVAIVTGYAVLAPGDLARATTLARPRPAPTPGPVSEYLGKPVERAP